MKVTVTVFESHFMFEEDWWNMKLNELRRLNLSRIPGSCLSRGNLWYSQCGGGGGGFILYPWHPDMGQLLWFFLFMFQKSTIWCFWFLVWLDSSKSCDLCVSYFNSSTAEVNSQSINSEDELLVQIRQLQALPLALTAKPDSNHQRSTAAWFAWCPSSVPCACNDGSQINLTLLSHKRSYVASYTCSGINKCTDIFHSVNSFYTGVDSYLDHPTA